MHIYGLDFTSAPNRRKPITCISCAVENGHLLAENVQKYADFAAFENFLRLPAPWLAALDFPFGLPRPLLVNLGWPVDWTGYVRRIADLGKAGFEQAQAAYRQTRPAGDKYHLRSTNRLAGARSPMMLHRVPVGKMFFQGATRLLNGEVSILPVRPTADPRIVLEGYPALVARTFIGRRSYKSDEHRTQTPERQLARQELLELLCSPALMREYGLSLDLSTELRQQLIHDPTGDYLDALLCAIQAAWASTQPGFGIPEECDRAEGWIVDPHIC